MGAGPLRTWTPASPARSLRIDAADGGRPWTTTTRTMLFLSRKVSRMPPPLCAQPSGYFIDHPAAASWKTRKTWLSGMSPVAAEAASACSAPGPVLDPPDVVVGSPCVTEELEPQPASATAEATVRSARGRRGNPGTRA